MLTCAGWTMKQVMTVAVLLTAMFVGSADAQPTASTLTNADVIRFVAMNFSDAAVITLIEEAGSKNLARFDLSPSGVSDLMTHGVSATVIAAMRRPPAAMPAATFVDAAPPPSALAKQTPGLKTTLDPTIPGIQPLTPESLQQALKDGDEDSMERALHDANDPMLQMLGTQADRAKVFDFSPLPIFANIMKERFYFIIKSPYQTAKSLSRTARLKFEPRPTVSVADLNSRQVVIHVYPSDNFAKADAIQNVVIKRGSEVLRPIKAVVTPTEIKNLTGATRIVAEGDFTFPFGAFDPSTAITIALIGKDGTHEWPLTRIDLARMK